ncbi:hypothetical protein E2C01_068366 [Portunus trituberculatus]|uniref:Uncharacterized protein n=1 Tax=Portunus trituberculatus TaxID=210409 RepID=A0A5B7HM74_PORTR|nr:hypothetical protein [Portunus trituberculatus]
MRSIPGKSTDTETLFWRRLGCAAHRFAAAAGRRQEWDAWRGCGRVDFGGLWEGWRRMLEQSRRRRREGRREAMVMGLRVRRGRGRLAPETPAGSQ